MIAEKDFAGRQSLGTRENQQDFYAFAPIPGTQKSLLLVLADGMGGYRGGEEASRLAVETFIQHFPEAGAAKEGWFKAGVMAANAAILAGTESNPEEFEGMGTTLVAVAVTAAGLEWTSVGDSALFLLRNRTLKRLNADHSMRAVISQQVQEGRMSAKEAATHPQRTQLLSALIGEEISLLDSSTQPLVLQDDDLVLMASDGLDTLARPKLVEILNLLHDQNASEIAAALLRAVKNAARPRQDNTTVAVMKLTAQWLQEMQADPVLPRLGATEPVCETRKISKSPRFRKKAVPKG